MEAEPSRREETLSRSRHNLARHTVSADSELPGSRCRGSEGWSAAANEHEQCDHPALFRHENVVGPAGGVAAHHLDAGTEPGETGHDVGARQVVLRAGTDEQDLGVEVRDVCEYPGIDVGEPMDTIAEPEAIRRQDEGGNMSYVVDDEEASAVCTNEVGVRIRIGVELHG